MLLMAGWLALSAAGYRLRVLAPWLAAQKIYNECRLAPVRQAAFLL